MSLIFPLKSTFSSYSFQTSTWKEKAKASWGCCYKKKLVSVLKVDQTELKEEFVQSNIPAGTQSKENDLDYLVDCMTDKLKISNRRKRLQILTLVPNSWSLRKAAEVFSVSKSTIQKAWLLWDEKGIAEYPDLLKQQKLTEETINKIKIFQTASWKKGFCKHW